MHIERLEKLASEKVDVSLNQKRAELLRHRIEELDRLLAMLNGENEKILALWRSRSTGFVSCTRPKLRQRLPR